MSYVLGHASAASTVGLAHDIVHERLPSITAVEVTGAADEERLIERALQHAVGGLHVPVLLLRADLGRAGLHPKVAHDRQVVLVERTRADLVNASLAVGDPMRRGRGVVGLVPLRCASELKESALHAMPYRRDRLGQADARPSPIGVRQHEDAQHVHEHLPDDRHRELRRPREVGLRGLTRPVQLREHHVLVGSTLSPPGFHTTLERPQLPALVAPRILLREHVEQGLRLQRWRLDEHHLQLRPVRHERVLARPPCARLHQLRRQLAAFRVLARGLPIHTGAHRREAHTSVLRHLFHQLPHLRVRRFHRRMVRSGGTRRRSIGAPQDGAM